ncbi:MAG: hypothetical protein UZ17_ACD001001079 [Acidobacteria bacterium OLB17]|nr:MAG: hypothetical protein UZ17_ACD001001079 [Acidobacteria bacterium OLB17]MCZ2391961.1 hypothetical protein [Acidobacteriota bacterium]
MKNLFFAAIFACALILLASLSASAQTSSQENKNSAERASSSAKGGNAILNTTGKVAVVVVRSAAKGVWATTKFTAKNIAKPILFKAVPKLAKYSLKGTGLAAKHLLPFAAKLAVL